MKLARVATIRAVSKSYRDEVVYRVSVSSSHSLLALSPTTLMSHDVLSRAFLRAAAPRVSSKAAADNNWQATGQRSQPFWLRKPAFLSFLEAETDSTFFPRKCSKYGVLISDQLKRVSYLFTEKQKHGYDERINVVNEEKNKFFVFLGRRVLVPVFSNDELYIYIYEHDRCTIGEESVRTIGCHRLTDASTFSGTTKIRGGWIAERASRLKGEGGNK